MSGGYDRSLVALCLARVVAHDQGAVRRLLNRYVLAGECVAAGVARIGSLNFNAVRNKAGARLRAFAETGCLPAEGGR